MAWYGTLLITSTQDGAAQGELPVPSLSMLRSFLGHQIYSISSGEEHFFVNSNLGNFAVGCMNSVESINSNSILSTIKCGRGFSVGLDDNKVLYSWGSHGDLGQIGQGAQMRKQLNPTPILHTSKFADVSCGKSFSIAIDELGCAFAWGDNTSRQLGIYLKSRSNMSLHNAMIEDMIFCPRLIPLSLKIAFRKVVCGECFAMAITKSGSLYTWGAGESGQLGTGRCTFRDVLLPLDFGEETASDIACGSGHAVALLSSGELYSWGLNHRGQCGLSDIAARQKPTKIQSSIAARKIFANGHTSAAIDSEGQLWTWGSARNGRLVHTMETVVTDGEFTSIIGCVCEPKRVEISALNNSIVETVAFSSTRLAVAVRSTLTGIWPHKGPKRSFSRLYIQGFGLWAADRILVRFSSQTPSIYNPPRSCSAKLMEDGIIVCKPPKFADVGVYLVDVSMDGGLTFLDQSFEILVYKEVFVSEQSPSVVDIRNKSIVNLVLKATGSIFAMNSNATYQDIVARNLPNAKDDLSELRADVVDIRLNFSVNEELVKTIAVKGSVTIDSSSYPESGGASNEKTLTIGCDDVDLSDLPAGIYEMRSVLSFNNQDFAPTIRDSPHSLCHAFSPEAASPSCYPVSELVRLTALSREREESKLENMSSLSNADDFHSFERKITVTGSSFFPSGKLPKNAHIMARLIHCEVANDATIASEVDGNFLGTIEELIVHCDTKTSMTFVINSNHWTQIYKGLSQLASFDSTKSITTISYAFVLETPTSSGHVNEVLCEKSVSIQLIPSVPLSLSQQLFSTKNESSSVSIGAMNSLGLSFKPSSCVVYLLAKDDAILKVLSSTDLLLENGHENEETQSPSHSNWTIRFSLPSLTQLKADAPNLNDFKDLYVGVSLDGVSMPPKNEWLPVHYLDNISQCSLHTPPPKGGFTAGSAIGLLLHETIDKSFSSLLRVRLRGNESQHVTSSLLVTFPEHAAATAGTVVQFLLPDPSALATVPPIMHGKEKSYFVDISVDNGVTFELGMTPLITVK